MQKPMFTFVALSFAGVIALGALSCGAAFAQTSSGSSVGVIVDATTTTTTIPPPTTTTTEPDVVMTPTINAPTTTVAPTTTTTTSLHSTTTTSTTVPVAAPDESVQTPSIAEKAKDGVRDSVASAAKTTQKLIKGIASGKPVADVAEAVLPAPVAQVVVPAVRTASTFVFPISLAVAVVAYLALQQRVDSSDPKLSASPLAHDDDMVSFS